MFRYRGKVSGALKKKREIEKIDKSSRNVREDNWVEEIKRGESRRGAKQGT